MRTTDLFRIEDERRIAEEHWDVVDSLNLLIKTGGISFNQWHFQSTTSIFPF
jgi:predicted SnoaL-like aldol condensation-catalyzing enzyme